MNHSKKFHIILSLVIIFFFMGFFSHIHAQSDNLIISPPIFPDILADPGANVINQLKLTNNADASEEVTVTIQDYKTKGESGVVILEKNNSTSYSLASWITPAKYQMNIEPHTAQFYPFTIHVPKNAEPGGRYAAIVASFSGKAKESGQSEVKTNLASILLVKVSGKTVYDAQISSFTITPANNIFQESAIKFSEKIQNRGNVHIKTLSSIQVKDMFGHIVKNITLPSSTILPNFTREYHQSFQPTGLGGIYTVHFQSKYHTQSNDKTIQAENRLLYIPTIYLYYFIGMSIFVILIIIISRKYRVVKRKL